MRTLLRPLGIAIVVWTGISMVALAQGTPAKQSATASKANSTDADAQHTLPSAHGSTLVTFKDAGPSKAGQIDPLDWPMWRGPEQNGISRETGLVDHFDLDAGENVLWTSKEAGGISTPVIMHGRLYTIVRRDPDTKREQECVVCLDAATGERLWESRHNLFLSGVPAERVGWSCVVADPETDRIYAQGVNGYFQCLEGATGKEIWSRSLLEEIGVLSVYGGRTNVPALFEDLVIAHSVVVGWGDNALPAHRFIAMDKNTGEVRWLNGTTVRPEDTIYSTPVMTVLDGEAAMVVPSADGSIWAIQPRTGKPIWNFRMSRRGINITPIIQDNIVYATQGEVNLDNRTVGSVVAINGVGHGDITATNAVWGPIKGIGAGKASPLLVDGRLYIGDDAANMYVFDAKTGKQIGRKTKLLGTMLNSSPVWADGRIYVMSVGALNVLEPAPNGLKVLSRTRLNSPLLIIGSPAISHGRIYLPTPTVLYCLGKKDQTPQATKRPEPPEENPIGDDTKPAWVQVSPVEVLLRPGEKQQFTVRLFNDRGQFLKESSAEFSVAGPGEINSQGQYTAPAGREHSACIVTAKVGELTGKARLRVIPPLPWKFDFNDVQLTADSKTGRTEGEPPATWVGARYRHKVRDIDGERVMVKVTYIPKGTRSQLWFGHPDLKNYTVKADLKAATKDNRLPDMGLVAQRYTLDLMGQSQQLQIRSWPPQVATHLSKTVPLEWKANIWYTMKFQAAADPSGEKVVLRGKVWPREEKEPASWTVEVVDETPNFYGSPGLYGDATLAEIYIDNIEVTPNQTPDTGSTAANAPSAGKSVAAQSTARPAAAKANGAK
jgi:outer membrane protein assembly factor BamB